MTDTSLEGATLVKANGGWCWYQGPRAIEVFRREGGRDAQAPAERPGPPLTRRALETLALLL